MTPTAIVTTTIRLPVFLKDVAKNIVTHGHARETAITVLGDEKTPLEVGAYCDKLARDYGLDVTYLDLGDQEQALGYYPELIRLVPHNNGVRKLLGGFLAWLNGCQTLIFVDDDNFPTEIDFVGSHRIAGRAVADLPVVWSETGWFNPYVSMVEERGLPFFPRGFSWRERRNPPRDVKKSRESRRVVLNSGLVLEDPDVDAVTRLTWPIRVLSMRQDWAPNFALAPGTWSSFNDQNASYAGDFFPAYFAPPSTGRNADIWASYVIRRLTDHFGDVVSFGYPLVRQFRNPHDHWHDLERELVNARANDAFINLIRPIRLKQSTYLGALGELLAAALERLPELESVSADGRQMIADFLKEYQVWQRVCARAEEVRRAAVVPAAAIAL